MEQGLLYNRAKNINFIMIEEYKKEKMNIALSILSEIRLYPEPLRVQKEKQNM